MLKQHGLHFGQGHISVVRWQSLLCQEGMGNQWNWPVQSSVPIGWLRSLSGKIWLSRVHRKLWKVLRDVFSSMEIWHINISPQLHCSISCSGRETGLKNFYIKAKCTQVDQRYRSDNVSSLISFIFSVSAAAASCCTVGHAIDLTVAKDTSCTLKDCYTKRWHW